MRLYNYINEGINDKGILKACFMSGSAASGKSWVVSKITSGSIQPRIVNTDTWTEYYMQFDPKYHWSEYSDKIKQLTKKQLANYLNSMLPLWIDGTSSNTSSVLRRKGILQAFGYDVAMIFVDTPVETAIERNKNRGRVVDEEFLKRAYEKTQKAKQYYSSEFRHFLEVKNGVGELTDEVILKAYKKMDSFFNSDVQNPIGKQLIEDMKEQGHKYLIDTDDYDMKYINKLVNSWYRS